jgi:polysaccharide biosynthesis protein PslH
MHILFLTQILPYPPDSGPKVKTWNVLKYLSQANHKITLASFVREDDLPYVNEVRNICTKVFTVGIKRSRIADLGYLLRSQFSGRPFLVERDDLSHMRTLVSEIVNSEKVDFIHADQLTMAQYALPFAKGGPGAPKIIFDAHNAVWTIIERMTDTSSVYMRIPLTLEAKRVKRYEAMIVQRFDHTLAVSEQDKLALQEAVIAIDHSPPNGSQPIRVIPIAVDTGSLRIASRNQDSLNIMTMGTLYYPPNADGIRWFTNEVFPLIRTRLPGCNLTIIGKNPPQDLVKSAEESGGSINVTGYVPDLAPFFDQSALIVIPVRAGGGIRVRILEAFARGMPVVTTGVGLEGIDARPGVDVLVADEPEKLAEAIVGLLSDQQLQDTLAANGRKLAEEKYDWQIVLKQLESIYTPGPP